MCGLAGIVNRSGEPVSSELLRKMTDVVAHRGPDGEGHYIDGAAGLGHRRLAIIDLSDAAIQPLPNENGDLHLIFNGEIYNFAELRAELEAKGHRFRSRTDSEVILHGYEEWGDACVERLNGMFAFALWDSSRRRLFVARDRYGIKPLYWYDRNGLFLFGSEVKSILAHPAVSAEVSYPALHEYFVFQNVFSDLTLFEGVRMLAPGCILEVVDGREPSITRYWDFPSFDDRLDLSEEEASDRLAELFVEAVKRQLVADVPVGAYLSGGMDSGSITSVAARHLPRMRTFTGGFDLSSASGLELNFDERATAEFLANRFKTEHYEVVLHAGDMEVVLPELVWHLEDLRVGQSYPNYYVARLASKFVTVALSGAGGDELFGGYPWRYYHGLDGGDPEEYARQYYRYWQRLVPDADTDRFYRDETIRQIGDHSTFDVFRDVFGNRLEGLETAADYVDASLYFEAKTFLHGLLVVDDKLSMAHSLETRVPFLDDELVEFASRLPVSHKLRDLDHAVRMDENAPVKRDRSELETNEGKMILRRAMSTLVPEEITDRTKQGFSAPDATWFRGESIDYINRLFRDPKALIYEFVQPEFVANVLDEHSSGRANRRLLIWSLLSFEWWCRCFLDGSAPEAAAAQNVELVAR
ncbi:MAG TPA: asparagine synthase (glutamine-hydrolyzing) [Gaiellaceae bacterium]|nr:asparagine synthase (glutamine-hydrolyzing) [Gaiellaceae bacterium]